MLKALAIKELRESAGLTVLAILGMVWTVSELIGYSFTGSLFGYNDYGSDYFAFLNDAFTTRATIFVGGLGIALGLKQSAWEHGRSTFYFLLHRPIKRWQVVGIKLLVGLALMWGVLAESILWYGWWASVPGKRAVPFEWSMALGAWKLALTLPLVYLGAFLSGMRPGQWFGTRLVPLVAAILFAGLASMIPLWWLTLPVMLVGYGCALTAISYHTQTRDY